MALKINETLLQKLFLNPKPLERKTHIFFNLHQRMFPCEDAFKLFLSTLDASEQLEHAKFIIQRLCFESNFPPSYHLLLNLLDFENDSINQSSASNYIPQDHFSHIIYTYLLGLYFFFYSPSFNKELTKEFIRKRNEPDFDLALVATKDFISYWKYFCLFHDLAYPIERSYTPKTDSKIFNLYLSKFNNLYNCLSREILIEGASKFLVVWQLLHDGENNLTVNEVLAPLSKFDFKQHGNNRVLIGCDLRRLFGSYQVVDKMHCFEHFKMVSSFVGKNDYVTVLFDALLEQPIALKAENEGNLTYYLLQSQYITIPENQIILYLDHEDYLWDYKYYVRYFFKDLNSKKQSMYLSYAGESFTDRDYQIIIDGIEQQFSVNDRIRFRKINTSGDLSNYVFQCYQALLSYIDETTPHTSAFPKLVSNMKANNNGKKVQKFLNNNFINFFKNAVIEQMPFSDFNAALESLNELDKRNIETGRISEVVTKAVDDLFDINKIEQYKKEITEHFSQSLNDAVDTEKRWNGAIVEFVFQCNAILFPISTLGEPKFLDSNNGVDYDIILNLLRESESTQTCISKMEADIQKRGDISLDELIKQYKTDFLTYDHGICGALFFLLSAHFYSKVITRLFARPQENEFTNIMSTLCWNIESSQYQNKLRANYDYITYAVFKSIFYHNLYPEEIRKKFENKSLKWSYSFLKEPSNYFGMMVDALQVWNRKKYYHHSSVSWQPLFSSDGYDIEIRNNTIVLKIQNRSSELEQISHKFITEKESYLTDFSSFFRIEIVSDLN